MRGSTIFGMVKPSLLLINFLYNKKKTLNADYTNIIGQFDEYIFFRYGRKFRMLSGLLISIVMGLSRSISSSYLSFLFFEFLDTALGSGAFACAFILGKGILPKINFDFFFNF